jgi:DNA polymerase-1
VEAALDRAGEVKRKTYRESLENNRDAVLLSKELVTIHCSVPLELNLDEMRTQPPDVGACRALFTELEFTTLLKELAPAELSHPVEYVPEPTDEDIAEFVREAKANGFALATASSKLEEAAEQVSEQESEAIEEAEPELKTISLFDLMETAEDKAAPVDVKAFRVAVAASADKALLVPLESVRPLLEDESVPKRVHDLKGTMRSLEQHGVTLRGADDDLMLYSYLINPTHASHRLSDIAARFSAHPLKETGDRELTEASHVIETLTPILHDDVNALDGRKVYETIDLPWSRCCCAWKRPAYASIPRF